MIRLRTALVISLVAVLTGAIVPATAAAKPTCGGKKATIVGTGGNDTLRIPGRGHGVQVVSGLGGNDTIITGDGRDRICGGAGTDRLISGRGADRVFGGDGDDYVKNNKGRDRIHGEAGNDNLNGGPSSDTIHGEAGDDLVGGATDRDRMFGGPGNDTMLGDNGSDAIYGNDGDDIMRGGSGGEAMNGGTGDDELHGELLDDDLDGGDGDDLLIGAHGVDTMKGGAGDDWLRGGTNNNQYAGQGGTDTASFSPATPNDDIPNPQGVTVSLPGGFALGSVGPDALSGIENVVGSAFNDDITGDDNSNVIDAGPGDDDVTGAGGADTLHGGLGNDSCDDDPDDIAVTPSEQRCGLGTAEAPADQRPPQAFVSLEETGPNPGLYVIGAAPSYTGGSLNENLTVSAVTGGIRVTSTSAVTADTGVPANCTQEGPKGVLCPTPASSLGFITVFGDNGNDTLSIGGGFPALTTTDVSGGAGSDVLNGSPGADVLFSGESGNDSFHGGQGEDALIAEGTGGDTMDGGAGNDQLVSDDPCQGHDYQGGSGFDVAGFARYELAATNPNRGVRAQLGGTATDPGRSSCRATRIRRDIEILEGSAADDTLLGNGRSNPLIVGLQGDDIIRGGGRGDQLVGSVGADSLYGEGGKDILDAADGQRDKVIRCGKGGGFARTDGRDPKPVQCGKGRKK